MLLNTQHATLNTAKAKHIFLAALLFLIATNHAYAQSLERAEKLANNGQYSAARASLAQWWKAHKTPKSADGAAVSRALLLRARLTTNPDSAEKDYLAIVLEHPASRETPEALLRLGQHFLARG